MNLKSLSSSERSKNLIFQISSSFLIKGLLFLITYAQFPLFNKFLSREEFGLWMTFISFYNWFILFDFGIGHGLKNILTEKLSMGNHDTLKKYSSSGIIGTLLISALFVICYHVFGQYLIQGSYLRSSINHEFLSSSITFTFYACMILFLHNSLSSFMYTMQKASYANYLNLLVNIFLLVSVSLLLIYKPDYYSSALVFLSQINFIFYLIVFIIICFLFFRKYRFFISDFKFASWEYFKEVLLKGGKFFFIQVSVLIIYPIDSFILANTVSPASVGDYNILIKIFAIFVVVAATITQSSWTSITESFYKKDYGWLKKLIKKLFAVNLLLIIGIVLVSFVLNDIIYLWMGKNYHFTGWTIALVGLLHVFYLMATVLTTILYSTNFLKSQIIIGVVLILLKFSLVYFLVINVDMGLNGVLISSLICFVVLTLFNSFYFVKKFRVIWTKE